ncbi:MAG TPA: FAD-dependent monooxygenase [Micromonosporaceae bacterium]|nr:FAD-dependent monooxygenase [Micromonosporaceae bacterium]
MQKEKARREERARRGLKVLVIGGGIGGLCLAHGLRAAGVRVAVYERDPSVAARNQGYRLHISPEGEQAMRDCLPPRVVELISATSNVRYGTGLAAYDEQLSPKWAPTFDDPRAGNPDKIDSVDRITLRHALLAGLDDTVHLGHRLVGHEVRPDGRVVAHFDGGARATGDVLVAADGASSRIREQYATTARPRDLGIRTIFGRIPMSEALHAQMSDRLRDRFSYVLGSDGYHVGMMPMVFRNPPRQVAARLWPGLPMDAGGDYYMCVFNIHTELLDIDDDRLFALSGQQLWDLVRARTAAWHPELRAVLAQADTSASFAVAMRATDPVEPWDTPPSVVPLGDAVHTMPPSGGVGANTALRDACGLTRALAAVDRGEQELPTAVADYQAAMVKYATESVNMSLRIAQWSIPNVEAPPAVSP